MLESKDYGHTVSFQHLSNYAVVRILTRFPIQFDARHSALYMWAKGVRLPIDGDSLAVRRYVALCAANSIKPFVTTTFVGKRDGFRVGSCFFSRTKIPEDLEYMVASLHLKGGLDHALLFRYFKGLEPEEFTYISRDYDVGVANLPFYLTENGQRKRGHLKVVQAEESSSESVPILELYVGKDFGLADQGQRPDLFHWITGMATR